jgi:uncharacterized protein (TIGR02996 family)
MTTEDDFHNALDAVPYDHHTRLVFADWLQDLGDPRADGYRYLGEHRLYPFASTLTTDPPPRWCWLRVDHTRGNPGQEPHHAVLPVEFVDGPEWPSFAFNTRREAEDAAALFVVKHVLRGPDQGGPCAALYRTDATFRLLVDEWAERERCPRELVDRLLIGGLWSAAAAALWAATTPPRDVDAPADTERRHPYPHRGPHRYAWYALEGEGRDLAHDVPQGHIPGHLKQAPSTVAAIVWLLDNWTVSIIPA